MTAYRQDPTQYGRDWAEDYDELEADEDLTRSALTVLPGLAAGRPVLEVAAGTGRLAVALAELGLDVTATDVSPDMIDVLRRKDDAGRVTTRVEAMEDIRDERRYGLVVNAWNSIWMLLTAQLQLAAVRSAADHLLPGGLLAVEVNTVPDDKPGGEVTIEFASGLVGTVRSSYDPATRLLAEVLTLPGRGTRSTTLRALQVPELIEMGTAAGLVTEAVTSGWGGPAFGPEDPSAVVLLRRP